MLTVVLFKNYILIMVVFAFLYAIKNLTLNQICNKVISLQSPNKRCYILIVDFYQLVVLAA